MYQTDESIMRKALALARRGRDTVGTNPMVGAVITDSTGAIRGTGWHYGPGTPHAEVHAIHAAIQSGLTDFSASTLHVTLEPCCHTGKTPPCTELILKTGIRRIVCGMTDPNPLVGGNGIRILREAGCSVRNGILEQEGRTLNAAFVTFYEKKRPYCTLKTASSLDGKITSPNGESRWITGVESRQSVHRLRARQAAIITGIGTVLADDPLLTVRNTPLSNPSPVRIVADTRLRIPEKCRLVTTAKETPLVVVCSEQTLAEPASRKKKTVLERSGVEILEVPEQAGHINLLFLVALLAERGIDRLLIEAGQTLAWSFLESGLVDLIRMYLAPSLIGGTHAMSVFGGAGIRSLDRKITISDLTLSCCGADIVLEGFPCLPD